VIAVVELETPLTTLAGNFSFFGQTQDELGAKTIGSNAQQILEQPQSLIKTLCTRCAGRQRRGSMEDNKA
jgi:K+-sensing histidine kinase KdpD